MSCVLIGLLAESSLLISLLKTRNKMIHNWDQKIERDAWFTSPVVADKVVQWSKKIIDDIPISVVVEPSAGAGAFVRAATKYYDRAQILAMDIEPKSAKIKKKDFFTFNPKYVDKDTVLVIGNPPFGIKSSLAIKFIKHSATFANNIIFILSENFRHSDILKNQLPAGYNVVKVMKLPLDIFVSETGEPLQLSMNTCAFYIKNTGAVRKKTVVKPNDRWTYIKIKDRKDAHIKISRHGNNGYFNCDLKTSDNYWAYTPYDYFIKLNVPTPTTQARRLCREIADHKFQNLVKMGNFTALRVKQLTQFLNKII